MAFTNADIAECLALVAGEYEDHRKKALKSGSRAAFLWEEEAEVLTSIEIVEVNPILDHADETGLLAVELAASALGARIL